MSAGTFATAPRGGVSLNDVLTAQRRIETITGRPATASQIARHLHRCVSDVAALLNPEPKD